MFVFVGFTIPAEDILASPIRVIEFLRNIHACTVRNEKKKKKCRVRVRYKGWVSYYRTPSLHSLEQDIVLWYRRRKSETLLRVEIVYTKTHIDTFLAPPRAYECRYRKRVRYLLESATTVLATAIPSAANGLQFYRIDFERNDRKTVLSGTSVYADDF